MPWKFFLDLLHSFGFEFFSCLLIALLRHRLTSTVSMCEWKHYQLVNELQGFGAVVGAISHNLADLQDLQNNQGSYISIYDQPAFSHPVFSHLHSRLYAVLLCLSFATSWFIFWSVYEVSVEIQKACAGYNSFSLLGCLTSLKSINFKIISSWLQLKI